MSKCLVVLCTIVGVVVALCWMLWRTLREDEEFEIVDEDEWLGGDKYWGDDGDNRGSKEG